MRILLSFFFIPFCACAEDVTRVEVKAASVLQQRRDDVAGRIVVPRDELLRYGDATLADALRRQPGVTMSEGLVQLQGLGGGRTQLLLNGEPAPPGFSPASLAPELVERIEILRSASVDSSTQGIAGSINIILRRSVARARALATLAANESGAGWSPEAALDLSRPGDDVSGGLSAQASRRKNALASQVHERTIGAERSTALQDGAASERVGLVPRLNWNTGGTTRLAWQGLLEHVRNHNDGTAQETALRGDTSDYPRNAYKAAARTTVARSDVEASASLGEYARVEWKAGVAHNLRSGDYLFIGSDAAGGRLWLRQVQSSAADNGASTSGKLRFGGSGGHVLAVGWDGALARRAEWRRQDDANAAGSVLGSLDQRYAARVRRLAMYAQDEWPVSPALDAYFGLRWEGLRTLTDGRGLAPVSSSSGIWSPVAHLLWRLPGGRGQLRLALARSYNAPDTRDLVPRRFTVNNGNGPANPDVQGNPALRPELAWGVDAAYERYFSRDGMLSIAAYRRRIANVIQPVLFEDQGKWVATPSNIGNASTFGIELGGRLALGAHATGRLDLARNWSRVGSVPAPGNRLGEQIPQALNAGLDVRTGAGTAAGFTWTWQGGGFVRNSDVQWSGRGTGRRLDLYASWQLRPGFTVRATASSALQPRTHTTQLFQDGSHDTLREVAAGSGRSLKLAAEIAL